LITAALRFGGESPPLKSKDKIGSGSIGIVSNQEPVMTLILIDEPDQVQREVDPLLLDSLASRGFSPDELIKLLSPDGAPAFDPGAMKSPDASTAASTLNAAQRAVLFGRYVGQVDARVERAWIKPRSPIGAPTFNCRVLITQDRDGNVKETTLQACNGDLRWQLSLVRGIQSASPLPSPPDQRVFADALTMNFTARPYTAGSNEDAYEPVAAAESGSADGVTAIGRVPPVVGAE